MKLFRKFKIVFVLLALLLLTTSLVHSHSFDLKTHHDCLACFATQNILLCSAGILLFITLTSQTHNFTAKENYIARISFSRFFLRAPPRS